MHRDAIDLHQAKPSTKTSNCSPNAIDASTHTKSDFKVIPWSYLDRPSTCPAHANK